MTNDHSALERISPAVLEAAAARAKQQGVSLEKLIETAVARHLSLAQEWDGIFATGSAIAHKHGITPHDIEAAIKEARSSHKGDAS